MEEKKRGGKERRRRGGKGGKGRRGGVKDCQRRAAVLSTLALDGRNQPLQHRRISVERLQARHVDDDPQERSRRRAAAERFRLVVREQLSDGHTVERGELGQPLDRDPAVAALV